MEHEGAARRRIHLYRTEQGERHFEEELRDLTSGNKAVRAKLKAMMVQVAEGTLKGKPLGDGFFELKTEAGVGHAAYRLVFSFECGIEGGEQVPVVLGLHSFKKASDQINDSTWKVVRDRRTDWRRRYGTGRGAE